MEAYTLTYQRGSDFSFSVKEGYYIEKIICENITTNEATLDLGLSATTDEILSWTIIPGTGTNNGVTIITLNYPMKDYEQNGRFMKFQPPKETVFYFNENVARGSSWNSAQIKFTIHLKPLKS